MTTPPETTAKSSHVLPELVIPGPQANGLDDEYWAAAKEGRLVVQRCRSCQSWQWGPEWACYECASLDVGWTEVPKIDGKYRGNIYSWERVWHPTLEALTNSVPYVILLVRIPSAGNIRMVGNLVGDQRTDLSIESEVHALFEQHSDYALVQWVRE